MVETARGALDLPARDCLFVDDDPELVAAAIELGYQAVFLRRSDEEPPADVPTIRALGELVPLVV